MEQKLAFVFPGQGSQSTGMLSDFYNKYAVFQETIKESSDILGYDLWNLITDVNNERLNKTEYTQPALLAVSIGLWKIWKNESTFMPSMLAGHSLGEYTALVAAESLAFGDALSLVSERGRLMQLAVEEGKGAMAAIIGLDNDKIESICEEASTNQILAACANYNAPGQVVIAGSKAAVFRAEEIAKESGARKVVILPVSVPSHCALMRPAADELGNLLRNIEFSEPKIPVIHNFDVTAHKDKNSICDVLIQQLYNPVRWVETIEFFVANGINKIIECGPGKVLTGLNKRIAKDAQNISIGDLDTFSEQAAMV